MIYSLIFSWGSCGERFSFWCKKYYFNLQLFFYVFKNLIFCLLQFIKSYTFFLSFLVFCCFTYKGKANRATKSYCLLMGILFATPTILCYGLCWWNWIKSNNFIVWIKGYAFNLFHQITPPLNVIFFLWYRAEHTTCILINLDLFQSTVWSTWFYPITWNFNLRKRNV